MMGIYYQVGINALKKEVRGRDEVLDTVVKTISLSLSF